MIDAIQSGLVLLSASAVAVAIVAPLLQVGLARERKKRTGAGWDARDTFEVIDGVTSWTAFMVPVAAAFSFCDAKLAIPPLQWWGCLTLLAILGSIPMQVQGYWSVRRRAEMEARFERA